MSNVASGKWQVWPSHKHGFCQTWLLSNMASHKHVFLQPWFLRPELLAGDLSSISNRQNLHRSQHTLPYNSSARGATQSGCWIQTFSLLRVYIPPFALSQCPSIHRSRVEAPLPRQSHWDISGSALQCVYPCVYPCGYSCELQDSKWTGTLIL